MIQTLCARLENKGTFNSFLELKPNSDEFKAINALLSLKLDDPKVYEWAFSALPPGNAFRTVLLAIVGDKAINDDVKTQKIQTLCARLLANEETLNSFSALKPDNEKLKAINALLSLKLETPEAYQWVFRDDDPGNTFRKVLLAIVDDKAINDDVKTQKIQTLCALQMKDDKTFALFLKLTPNSDESKAINALLSLKLENPTAYEWAVSDVSPGESFRKVLVAIVGDKAINDDVKTQKIQTLCALQMEKEETIDLFSALKPEDEKFKAINALLPFQLENLKAYQWAFSDDTHGKAFRTALLAIVADKAINEKVKPQMIQTLGLLKMGTIVENETINEKVKPQMIQTLCALQMEKEETIDLFSALNPEDEKFKAINALLTLKLENPTAYEWAVSDVPPGKSLRKVLLAIVDDKNIEPENQPQMIQTLCLLQVVNNKTFDSFYKLQPEEEEFKAINALLSLKLTDLKGYELAFISDKTPGQAFRKVLLAIHDADEKNIKAKDKPRMIQTLCALLNKNENTLNSVLELETDDNKFKVINALLSLKLENPKAYEFAFSEEKPGQAFRKILLAIHADQTITEDVKTQMIETLCSLLENPKVDFDLLLKVEPNSEKFKAINALLSLKLENPTAYEWAVSDVSPGESFKKSWLLLSVTRPSMMTLKLKRFKHFVHFRWRKKRLLTCFQH